MIWEDLLAAFALALVMEGIMPVASPSFFRRRLQQVVDLRDGAVRAIGLFSLIGGALLLYWVRHAFS